MMIKIFGYSKERTTLNSIQLCGTHHANVYIKILRSWNRDYECENKIKQKYLDGSAFAIVILRAKLADATVLHMQLWTHNILFNIDLWLMKHWTKSVYFLVDNWLLSFNCFNQPYLARPGPIYKISQAKIGRFDPQSQFYLLKNYFSKRNYNDSNRPWDVLSIEIYRY